MEFPVYFSLVPNPGYNISETEGEWILFAGYSFEQENGTWTWRWGTKNRSIEGELASLVR